MVTLRQAATALARDLFCTALGDPAARDIIGQGATLGLPGVERVQNARAGILDTAERLYCPADPVPAGQGPITSTGGSEPGQCPELYNLVVRVFGSTSSNPTFRFLFENTFNGLLGPLSSPTIVGNNLEITTATGSTVVLANLTGVIGPVWEIDYTLQSGGPDNCGEPSPANTTRSGPIDYDDENGNPVSETASQNQGPINFGPDGEPTICTTITTPTVELVVCFNPFSGDATVRATDLGVGADNCCPPLDENPMNEEAEEEPPEPETQQRFVGVVVVNTGGADDTGATQIAGPEATIYLPRIASISFAVDFNGLRFWTEVKNVQMQKQAFFVPDGFVAYTWNLAVVGNATFSVIPILVPEEVT